MMDSQYVGFLSKKSTNIDEFAEKIRNTKDIDQELKNDILDKLSTIIGPQEIEWLSRNDKKHAVDYIVHRYKFKFYPKLKKLNPFPIHLLIEPASFCNLRCVMCFQNDPYFKKRENIGTMELGFFKKMVDQAVENKCRALTLASRGEPSLNKNFGEMLEYCKDKFLELKVNVNAVRLSEELCYQILDSGVDIIVFSVDSSNAEEYERIREGADFETVYKNIKRFCEIRNSKKEYAKTSTRVSGIYLGYQDKQRFLEFWKDIVDTVAFDNAIPRWNTYENPKVISDRRCNLLWERMYVWFNGICNPCDSDYRSDLMVGDAKITPLKDIWLGEKYTFLRQMHLKCKRESIIPCDRCNQY